MAAVALQHVVGVHRPPAIATGDTIPVRERDVRAPWVVGVQNALRDLKKVEQAAAAQGVFDGNSSVPFTQHLVPDVRVGRVLAGA